ncbi:unnamed protein product [Ixodes pacificus]
MPTDMCGECSVRFYAKQQFLACSGPCNRRYHFKCIGVGQAEYEVLMQSGLNAYKCTECTRRRRTSSNDNPDTDDDRHDRANVSRLSAPSESAANESAPWETADLVRLLHNMSTQLEVLTAEVKSLKSENNFLRSEIGLLNKTVLERLPLAARPHASFAAAVRSSESSAGRPPLNAAAVQRPPLGEGATLEPNDSLADGDVPTVAFQVPGLRRDARSAATVPDEDGFIPVMRKRRSPTSTGTAKSEKVQAVPRQPPMKALFVSRLHPNTSVSDIEDLITPFLERKCVSVTKLKPKYHSYSSFHIACSQSDFEILNKSELWPEGSIFHQFFGKLDSSRTYVVESETAVNA